MDLEEYALKRDKRFLFRLVLMLAVGVLFSAFVFMKLTDDSLGGCAAQGFESLTKEETTSVP